MRIEVRGRKHEIVGDEHVELARRQDVLMRGRRLPAAAGRSRIRVVLHRTPTPAEFALKGEYAEAIVEGESKQRVTVSVQARPPVVVVEWDGG